MNASSTPGGDAGPRFETLKDAVLSSLTERPWRAISAALAVTLVGVSVALALKKQKCTPLSLLTGGEWSAVPWAIHPDELEQISGVEAVGARYAGEEARTVAAKVACNENESCVAFIVPPADREVVYYGRRNGEVGERSSVAFRNLKDQEGAKVHVHMGRVGGITCKDFGTDTCKRSF